MDELFERACERLKNVINYDGLNFDKDDSEKYYLSVYLGPMRYTQNGGVVIKARRYDYKENRERINQIGISTEIIGIDNNELCYERDELCDGDVLSGGWGTKKGMFRFYHFENDNDLDCIINKHVQPFVDILKRLVKTNRELVRIGNSDSDSAASSQLETDLTGTTEVESEPTGQSDSGADASGTPGTAHPLNLILYGPPGTGKTYSTIRRALEIIGEKVDGKSIKELLEIYNDLFWNVKSQEQNAVKRIAFTTFHQSYGYEEFIEGYRPNCETTQCETTHSGEQNGEKGNNLSYRLEPGCFKAFCNYARRNSGNFVFIIDEINRGNISKIFGELITLIEDDKRKGADYAQECILPYSHEPFTVPQNVYILGTMNTADRSLTRIDTALRRRFVFEEMMPEPDVLDNVKILNTQINLTQLLTQLNRRIEALYDREHQIGHAYFIKLKANPSIDALADVMKRRIIPLLQEYFFDDWEKIRLVLGDNQKVNDEPQFIEKVKQNSKDLFGDSEIEINPCYRINEAAFRDENAYFHLGISE